MPHLEVMLRMQAACNYCSHKLSVAEPFFFRQPIQVFTEWGGGKCLGWMEAMGALHPSQMAISSYPGALQGKCRRRSQLSGSIFPQWLFFYHNCTLTLVGLHGKICHVSFFQEIVSESIAIAAGLSGLAWPYGT